MLLIAALVLSGNDRLVRSMPTADLAPVATGASGMAMPDVVMPDMAMPDMAMGKMPCDDGMPAPPGKDQGDPCEQGCCTQPTCDVSACLATGLLPSFAPLPAALCAVSKTFAWHSAEAPSWPLDTLLRPPIARIRPA
jgi:hypothetical protein